MILRRAAADVSVPCFSRTFFGDVEEPSGVETVAILVVKVYECRAFVQRARARAFRTLRFFSGVSLPGRVLCLRALRPRGVSSGGGE